MNKQPKYSFGCLLETPTDRESRKTTDSSLADASSNFSRWSNSSTPGPGSRFKVPRTPLSTSSGAGRTPRGVSSTTPYSTVSNENESSTIVAIVEGRGHARGEIGISSFDLKQSLLVLSQFSDCQTYVKTLAKLQILNPLEILLPNTMCEMTPGNNLFTCICEYFPNVTRSSVQRRYYNENKGLQFVKHLCADEYKAIELLISTKYYCLATTAALVKYIEFVQNIIIAPKSLKVVFKGSEKATMIDSSTVKNLELVQNLKDINSQQTLFGVLNHTKTAGGARLLRSNILQPVNDEETIKLRQETVNELIGKEDIFYNLQTVVSKFPDIGHVVSVCVQIPKQETVKNAESKINCVIMTKHIVQMVSSLREQLSYCENPLLKAYCQVLESPSYDMILDKINEVISAEAHYTKGLLQQKVQKCNAVKAGVNGILDVARRTHDELINDMQVFIETLGTNHNLPLRTAYSNLRGHHIQLPVSAAPMNSSNGSNSSTSDVGEDNVRCGLPSNFIKVSRFKNTLSFTTMELLQLNQQIVKAMDDIFMLANIVVTELLSNIRNHIGCLYELSDIVSMVDMLLAFAHSASLYSYVAPEFTDTFAVKQGLHPILQTTGTDNYIPNDIYATEHSNFIIITGPNMGGKSTYLRQVALHQIMAQIGSFVPAVYASVRIVDQIFSRIGSEDDIESNSSTFSLEMKETNYILQHVTDLSLVIIDELGRGTSAEEGAGICWAVAEKLLATKAMTFFVTHFLQLTDMSRNYPNVVNYHFEVQRVLSKEANCEKCTFSHIMTRGTTPETHYGLKTAEMLSLPQSVLKNAKSTAAMLDKVRRRQQQKDSTQIREHAMFNLATKCIQVAKNSRMEEDGLRIYLKSLRKNYLAELAKCRQAMASTSTSSNSGLNSTIAEE